MLLSTFPLKNANKKVPLSLTRPDCRFPVLISADATSLLRGITGSYSYRCAFISLPQTGVGIPIPSIFVVTGPTPDA